MTDTTDTINRAARVDHADTEAPPVEPSQWQTLCTQSEDLMWKLTPELNRLNTFSELDDGAREIFRGVAQRYRKIQTRYLCQIKPPATKAVLDAIVSRTLDFRKFAEKITYKQFVDGVVDKGGQKLLLDEDGVPIFNGLEISKTTVATSIHDLLRHRLIERFSYMRGTTVINAYMPFSREFLAANLTALAEGYFGRDERAAEYRATIEAMLGGIESRWPADERLPHWADFNLQEFYRGNGFPSYTLTKLGEAQCRKEQNAKKTVQKPPKSGPGTKI